MERGSNRLAVGSHRRDLGHKVNLSTNGRPIRPAAFKYMSTPAPGVNPNAGRSSSNA